MSDWKLDPETKMLERLEMKNDNEKPLDIYDQRDNWGVPERTIEMEVKRNQELIWETVFFLS